MVKILKPMTIVYCLKHTRPLRAVVFTHEHALVREWTHTVLVQSHRPAPWPIEVTCNKRVRAGCTSASTRPQNDHVMHSSSPQLKTGITIGNRYNNRLWNVGISEKWKWHPWSRLRCLSSPSTVRLSSPEQLYVRLSSPSTVRTINISSRTLIHVRELHLPCSLINRTRVRYYIPILSLAIHEFIVRV